MVCVPAAVGATVQVAVLGEPPLSDWAVQLPMATLLSKN